MEQLVMKKIITLIAVSFCIFASPNVFAGDRITVSKWFLVSQKPTSTPFVYSCDYVRSVFVNGIYVTQQTWTGGAWWACPVTL